MSEQERRLVLVVGVGRSGTSLLSGILGQLGLHIPVPEVKADATNPRGFGEPRWVVDFHTRLLRRLRVTVNDSRPAAWDMTAAVADDEAIRAELASWLRGQYADSTRVVVKDPRTVWFLPLWRRVAGDEGLATSFVTMLREPAEIIASAKKSYGDWQTDASRAAAWLNVMLETEHSTRAAPRAFVRYEDLLADWPSEIRRVGELTGDPLLAGLERSRFPAVDEFVDPTLHRNRIGWEQHEVPESVRELADGVWELVQGLARPGGDASATYEGLDVARTAFAALYGEAEAIAQSSVTAAGRGRAKGKGRKAPAADPTLRVRLMRRIPARYRRRVRTTLRSLRG
jgi:hypothetical protein